MLRGENFGKVLVRLVTRPEHKNDSVMATGYWIGAYRAIFDLETLAAYTSALGDRRQAHDPIANGDLASCQILHNATGPMLRT